MKARDECNLFYFLSFITCIENCRMPFKCLDTEDYTALQYVAHNIVLCSSFPSPSACHFISSQEGTLTLVCFHLVSISVKTDETILYARLCKLNNFRNPPNTCRPFLKLYLKMFLIIYFVICCCSSDADLIFTNAQSFWRGWKWWLSVQLCQMIIQ